MGNFELPRRKGRGIGWSFSETVSRLVTFERSGVVSQRGALDAGCSTSKLGVKYLELGEKGCWVLWEDFESRYVQVAYRDSRSTFPATLGEGRGTLVKPFDGIATGRRRKWRRGEAYSNV